MIIRLVIVSVFSLSCLYACMDSKGKKSSQEAIVLNDILLATIDTAAYSHHSLIPVDTRRTPKAYTATDSFVIALSNELQYPKTWIGRIRNELADHFGGTGDTAFGTVLLSIDQQTGTETINVANIVNKGRFTLTDQYDFRSKETREGFVGVLIFSRIFLNASLDRAITVVEIRGAIKGGREELFFLKKENGRWVIQNRLLLAIA